MSDTSGKGQGSHGDEKVDRARTVYGRPSYGKPSFGKPTIGKPFYGKSSFEKTSYGRPAKPGDRPYNKAPNTHRRRVHSASLYTDPPLLNVLIAQSRTGITARAVDLADPQVPPGLTAPGRSK
jgi:hypothetical protein